MLKQFITVLLLAIIPFHIYRVCYRLQYERSDVILNHRPGPCKQILGKEGNGSEDIQTLPDGLTFITSGVFQSRKGRILTFNFTDEKLQELKIDGILKDFHPLGMNIWTDDSKDTLTVYVVNHGNQIAIEVFEYTRKSTILKHMKTIDTDGRTMNNLVLIAKDQFYITEYMRFPINNFASQIEMYGMFNLGRVWFYNGKEFKEVLSGLGFPNGIAASKDKSVIYLAEVFKKQVSSFKRRSDNSLELLQTLFVDTVPDNINVDPDTGDLWIGCQPRLYSILNYGQLEGRLQSPSQVIKIKTEDRKLTEITEVFLDDGRLISGSAVASYYKGKLLIGTVGTELVVCDVLYNN